MVTHMRMHLRPVRAVRVDYAFQQHVKSYLNTDIHHTSVAFD